MTAPKKQASRYCDGRWVYPMQTVPMIKEFFEQMEQHVDPSHVAKLRAEWTTLTIGQTGRIAAHDPAEWRQLMEEYDERIGIMTEGRQITDEDVLAAWEQVLEIGRYQKQRQITEKDKGGTNE